MTGNRLAEIDFGRTPRGEAGYGDLGIGRCRGPQRSGSTVAISDTGRYAAVAIGSFGSSAVTLLDFNDQTRSPARRSFEGHSASVRALAFRADNRHLVSGSEDGLVGIWDLRTSRRLATLVLFDDGEWLVLSPDGLFDESPGAWTRTLWRFSSNPSDVTLADVFINDFFYPGLLAEIMSGNRPRAPKDIARVDRRQPTLKIDAREELGEAKARVRIHVAEARSRGTANPAGVRDVRLFRNGSLVRAWRGDLALDDEGTTILETTVAVTSGENHFSVYGN